MKELDECCGAFCSEAGCCPFEVQGEMFPGAIRDQLPVRKSPEWIPRKRNRVTPRKPYQVYKVPDWIKEGRNRDTPSNLDYEEDDDIL